jgi:acyl carrier protein
MAADDHLIRCFCSVFPELNKEEILAADVGLFNDMDSLTGVTLVALIDKEFDLDLDLEDLLKLGTFEAVQQYVHDQTLSNLVSQEKATQ